MYLVYNNSFGEIYPICICNSASDAEEMCLALAEEAYYHHYIIMQQLNYSTNQTLFTMGYDYKEVPFIG